MSGDTFHVHVMMSIPPKYAVAQIIDFIKGKSAIQIAKNFVGRKKNFTGQHFWARGYHVSTVGRGAFQKSGNFLSYCHNLLISLEAMFFKEKIHYQ